MEKTLEKHIGKHRKTHWCDENTSFLDGTIKTRNVFAVREIDAFLWNLTAKDYFNELKEVAARS